MCSKSQMQFKQINLRLQSLPLYYYPDLVSELEKLLFVFIQCSLYKTLWRVAMGTMCNLLIPFSRIICILETSIIHKYIYGPIGDMR